MRDIGGQIGGGVVLAREVADRLAVEPRQSRQLDRLDPSLPILDVGQPGARNLEIGGNFLLLEPEIFARLAQPLAEPPPLGLVIVLMRRKVHFLGPFLRTQARSIRGIRCSIAASIEL
jgi:hypothetical protein